MVKTLHGSQGKGVRLVNNFQELGTLIRELKTQHKPYLIQQFIEGAGGKDIRCFVVGDRVIAGMERQAREGDFRANLAQGGKGSPSILNQSQESLALQASKLLGLRVAGIDLIPTGNGYQSLLLEANASPGPKIEEITKRDVIRRIVDEAALLAEEAKARKVETTPRELSLIS